MKSKFLVAVLACLCAVAAYSDDKSGFTTDKQKFSYAVGHQIAENIKSRKLDVDPKALTQAIQDDLTGAPSKLSVPEMQAAFAAYQQKQLEERMALATKNKEAGDKFLAENKKKQGVVALPSGLQYRVIKAGNGQKPKVSDTVVVNYRGTLINGEEFDSSYARGQPASFELANIIKGWQEVLPLMPVGSKWQVVIPPDLAYGERGAGDAIGPNETLVFEIELLSIK
jgi:FKBP-type peptidyl-prolyl cis-trans isomerase FklB